MAREPPRSLHIVTPNGQQALAGEYQLQRETANGCPLWKQDGGYWLYSGANGMWIIGTNEAKEKGFKCSNGMMYCKAPHGGVTPDRLRSIWLRVEGGESFAEDSDISVTSGIQFPINLSVIMPHSSGHRCAGTYQMLGDYTANGMPVWKQEGGVHWLFSGKNHKWIIGTDNAAEKKFECSTGVVHSKQQHGGLMPDKMTGLWMRLEKGKFCEDSGILVVRPPGPLYVQSPNGQQKCAGEYRPAPDMEVNGQRVWEHTARTGECWLYSSSNGTWRIGEDCKSNKGLIFCKTQHMGNPPDRVNAAWLRLEGSISREDVAISVSATPLSLYVVSPNGQQRCAGEYRRTEELLNGFPVWQQTKGECWLFSSGRGSWAIGGNAEKEGVTNHPGVLVSCCSHYGRNPDKVAGSWARATASGLEKDVDIVVTPFLFRPARLFVTSPNGQRKCCGEYELLSGEANGQPLWQHKQGRYWLFSAINGTWNIGGTSVKEKNFNCGIAVIFSGRQHGGVMPDKAQCIWQRHVEKEVFQEDPQIVVSARPPTPTAKEQE